MTEGIIIAIIGAAGLLLGAVGGHLVSDRKSKRDARVAAAAAEAAASAAAAETSATAQDRFIDQLQEELKRYRDENDQRVDRLEDRVDKLTEENQAYRSFIGIQRDHMAAHNIPLPPWPEGLPR